MVEILEAEMKRKTIAERALELACDRVLKLAYREVQMTMYDGKWEEMVARQVAYFIDKARLQGKK
jgi:hypothetical protein